MASEVLVCDREIAVQETGLTLVGGESVPEVIGDDDVATYVSGMSVITATTIHGIKLGLPQPTIAGPIKRVDVTARFLDYEQFDRDDSGFAPVMVYVPAIGGNTFRFGATPGSQFDVVTRTLTRDVDLPASAFGSTEVWISLSAQINGEPQTTVLYDLSFTILNEPAVGYDAPPDPIPSFILAPPRRQFVYPY